MHADARAVEDDVVPPRLHLGKGDKAAELLRDRFEALFVALIGKDVRARFRKLFDAAPARAARAEDEHVLPLHRNARVFEHQQKPHAVGVVARAAFGKHDVDRAERLGVPFELFEVRHDVRLEGDGDVEGVVRLEQPLGALMKFFGRDAHRLVGTLLAQRVQQKGVHRGALRLRNILADDS